MEGIQEAIKSQQFIVSDMKSHHKTVVESPGSVITDYTFPNHSLDDEMAEAASLMEEKAASLMEEKMSGNAEKNKEKKLRCQVFFKQVCVFSRSGCLTL